MPPLAARCGQAIAGAGASAAARRQLLRGPVVSRQRATNVVAMAAAPATTVKLQAVKLTPEAFAPFGQVGAFHWRTGEGREGAGQRGEGG
eukprot:298297-Chlamydomonas_euryale.AAC.1